VGGKSTEMVPYARIHASLDQAKADGFTAVLLPRLVAQLDTLNGSLVEEFMYALDGPRGSKEELKKLLEGIHQRGMKAIAQARGS
jgi:glycosidase